MFMVEAGVWIPLSYGFVCISKSYEPTWLCSMFNSLWAGDAIQRHISKSTLSQVMACCLTAPSHYLNQCSLIISKVLWHSHEDNFTGNVQDIDPWNEYENHWYKITIASPSGQWSNEARQRLYGHVIQAARHPGRTQARTGCRPTTTSKI